MNRSRTFVVLGISSWKNQFLGPNRKPKIDSEVLVANTTLNQKFGESPVASEEYAAGFVKQSSSGRT